MQALVLAGGQGTRLRPLTLDIPKPVVPRAGRPFLSYMLDWLEDHGVDHVVLSCGFLSDGVRSVLGSRHGDLRISYVEEGYWKDIGTPTRYVEATRDLLSGRISSRLPERDFSDSLAGSGATIRKGAILDAGARIAPGAVVEAAVRTARRAVA